MALNVSLPPELEIRVRQRVESGFYGSASEVIREALRLLESYEKLHETKLAALQADITVGLEQLKNGKGRRLDVTEIKHRARLRTKKKM